MKKYRIKKTFSDGNGIDGCAAFIVQVRTWWGSWVNVKVFYDPWDTDFAKLEAEELLEHLQAK